MKTKDAPGRPVFVFDSECPLCRLAARRWKKKVGEYVDFVSYQELGGRFPDIPRSVFESQPVFIMSDGRLYLGAEAVVRTWSADPARAYWAKLFDCMPGFSALAKAAFWLVSRCRECSYKYARVIWREKG